MELRDLRVYLMVCEVGGVTRAAERLHVVQSTVSQAIKRLENELGVRLLERRRHGVETTEAGTALQHHAHLIVNTVNRAENDLAAHRDLRQGRVEVGLLHTAVPLVLAPLLQRVNRAHPGFTVRVRETMADELIDLLKMRSLDLAVIFLPAQTPGLEVEELANVELVVATAPHHPIFDRDRFDRAVLADVPWVSFPPHNPGRMWLKQTCDSLGFEPKAVIEVDTLSHLKTFVESGSGIALLPPQACEPERLLGSLVTFRLPEPPTVSLAFATDPHRPATLGLTTITPHLRDVGRRLSDLSEEEGG